MIILVTDLLLVCSNPQNKPELNESIGQIIIGLVSFSIILNIIILMRDKFNETRQNCRNKKALK